MHKTLAVNELERRQHRAQHPAYFLGRECPLRKNLRQVLFRKFLDRVHQLPEAVRAILCTSHRENTYQVRMHQFARGFPLAQLALSVCHVRQFDRQVRGFFLDSNPVITPTSFDNARAEYSTLIGAAQIIP